MHSLKQSHEEAGRAGKRQGGPAGVMGVVRDTARCKPAETRVRERWRPGSGQADKRPGGEALTPISYWIQDRQTGKP